ncbi:MAG: Fe-S cluster assembly protein SufD [Actinomyces sp.]|jgi:Fe-S cluster assembly protein SufD|nr:Fe-S cluster assembly protein SufD [Actinomyces sp.]MCI1642314.1 Fe-S cluster assembly protein SufD [Actinomyces sp.]MCI1662879.1 Fe-S cluster assembly protein SufD [Actinomyces sp.]MCI1691440.1 Fe-S cluster assembly protein SufD [Actinomyces sp.]MCI1788877.1 Fe-S cluster assembly protein SufD [Actinomyces sp.]MCI1830669.1 Fe-S cluster assembly protein SufD [Actinomyces sp.]
MSTLDTMSRPHSHGGEELGPRSYYSSRADRPTSFDIDDIPTPTGREEDWRFTPIRRVRDFFDTAGYSGVDASASVRASGPVRVETVGRDDPRLGQVLEPGDRTAVVSWAAFHHSTVVTIPKGADVEEPVVIDVTGSGEIQSQHILIRAEELSRATVLLDHTGKGAVNQTVEVDAGDGANLTVVSLQEWDATARHASNQRLRLGKDTILRHVVVSLGGDLVRVCADTDFAGSGGELTMLGLYFVDAGQHLEHRVFVDHDRPNCYSRVTYKGALQGKGAHSVWIGDCLIGKNADNTDTYELNRNLVLTEGAKADSVPNLEIENGEIKGAGHASATGRFDDEQLFYLMSRGVSEEDARGLVVRGFFAEVINQIDVPSISAHLTAAIEAELQRTRGEAEAEPDAGAGDAS